MSTNIHFHGEKTAIQSLEKRQNVSPALSSETLELNAPDIMNSTLLLLLCLSIGVNSRHITIEDMETESDNFFRNRLGAHCELWISPLDVYGLGEDNPIIAGAPRPKVDWSYVMTAIPRSIAILRQLLLLTSSNDLSINSAGPRTGWQYVEHPFSLKRSFVQLAKETKRAAMAIHKNAEGIRVEIEKARKILTKEKLPENLAEIVELEQTVARANRLANETVEKNWRQAAHLTEELLMGCLSEQAQTDRSQEKYDKLEEVIELLAPLQREIGRIQIFVQRSHQTIEKEWGKIMDRFTNVARQILEYGNTLHQGDTTKWSYHTAFKASELGYRISHMLNSYMKVSNTHLLRPLTRMDNSPLLSVDTSRNRQLSWAIQHEISNDLADAEEDIKQTIEDEKEDLNNYMILYREKLSRDLMGICERIEEMRENQEDSTEYIDFLGGFDD